MANTSRQMRWICALMIVVTAVTVVGYHFLRAGDIQLAQARRAFDAGRFDVAEEALERATHVDPNHPEAWRWLGITRKCLGDIPGSADALARAVELNDGDVNWWFDAAQVQQWARRFDEAEHAWKRTLELLPPDDGRVGEARTNLARVMVFQGDVDRGVTIFTEMLDSANDPDLRFVLAELLMWAGRLEESAEHYRLALQQKSEESL